MVQSETPGVIQQLRDRIAVILQVLVNSSRRMKFVIGSAFALAFLVAPAAALMMSGNPDAMKSNIDATTDPGNAEPADSNSNPQDNVSSTNTSNTDQASTPGSNTSVNVNNGVTTVTVDGKTVVGPTDQPVSKTITNSDGSTNVNVQSNNNSSGFSSTSSFSYVNSNSSSNTFIHSSGSNP